MLGHVNALKNKIALFLEKVEPLHTIAAMGVANVDSAAFEDNLRAVAARWSVVDVRRQDEASMLASLSRVLETESLFIVVCEAELPVPVELLIRAFAGEEQQVDLGGGRSVSRYKTQSCLLLCWGVSSLDGVAPQLEEITFWDFLR